MTVWHMAVLSFLIYNVANNVGGSDTQIPVVYILNTVQKNVENLLLQTIIIYAIIF